MLVSEPHVLLFPGHPPSPRPSPPPTACPCPNASLCRQPLGLRPAIQICLCPSEAAAGCQDLSRGRAAPVDSDSW